MEPLPVAFIYRGGQLVATRVLHPVQPPRAGVVALAIAVDDLPCGEYEYETSDEPGKRYPLYLR